MRTKDLRELERRFAGRKPLDESDAEELRRALLSDDGRISRKEAKFLVRLRERVPDRTPRFERFVYETIRKHLLDDDVLSATEWKWLSDVLFADQRIDERENELLCRLRDGARVVNPEFDALLLACLDARQNQRGPGSSPPTPGATPGVKSPTSRADAGRSDQVSIPDDDM